MKINFLLCVEICFGSRAYCVEKRDEIWVWFLMSWKKGKLAIKWHFQKSLYAKRLQGMDAVSMDEKSFVIVTEFLVIEISQKILLIIFILPMLSVWPKQMWIVRVVQLALTKAQLKPQCVHWSNGLSAIWAMCQGKRYLELPSIGVNIHLRVCCFLIRKIKILITKKLFGIIFCVKLLKIMIKKEK